MNKEIDAQLSKEDLKFLKKFNKKDLEIFIDFVSTAASYEVITNGIPNITDGTHQFVRDIQIAQLLKDKFPNVGAYTSSEGFESWLEDRLSGSLNAQANALSRLQGDGAGEIDFLRNMQGNLRSFFYKTDFIRDASGHIPNNTEGIDFQEVNRITGEIVQKYQVKTLRSMDSVKETLKDFLNNNAYDEKTVLVGPKELIEEAKKQEMKNPTKVMGSIQDNANSADTLKNKVLDGEMTTKLTTKAVIGKVVGGVVIGATVSIGISALTNFIAYRKGNITRKELFYRVGKDGAKGAISGGALAGLSLFVPGGIIGMGVGFIVGTSLRRVLDDAFGDGVFAEILDLTHSVQVNVKMLHEGSIYVAELVEANGKLMSKSITELNDIKKERYDTENKLGMIEEKYHNSLFTNIDESLDKKLKDLDLYRERMKNGYE